MNACNILVVELEETAEYSMEYHTETMQGMGSGNESLKREIL
jgi:hypothetical protein